jgi:hypothetical protein
MSKCFQAIEKLKLDNEKPPAGQRPKGLGMVSCVGTEYVEFSQPLPLENKVRPPCVLAAHVMQVPVGGGLLWMPVS